MRGVWTALITPFNEKNELDLDAFRKILQDQKDAKVTGVVPCGTTAESPTLSDEEKKTLIQVALEELKGSDLKVIAGTGSYNTAESVEFSVWADQQGVDGVLLVTPYYNKPTQLGLESHFRKIADSIQCETILYVNPTRTGVLLNPDTIARLSEHPRIRTLKDATGNISYTSEVLEAVSSVQRSIDIVSGDDATYLALLAVGGVGTISVASNLFPRAMVAIQKAVESENLSEALKIHQKYFPLFKDLFVESNPVPIKWAMSYAGWCRNDVRLPLAPLSGPSQERLLTSLKKCGIVPGKLF